MDVKNLMNVFLAEQQEQEAKRAKKKEEKLLVRGRDDLVTRPMKAKEVQRYARTFGFSVEDGRGRHGVHLVAPNGSECPLPVHGGGRTLANGTQRSIVSFIHENGMSRK